MQDQYVRPSSDFLKLSHHRACRMIWFWTTLILVSSAGTARCFEGNNEHEKKGVPSAVVVGTVYCSTCFSLQYPSKATISGATVAVECNTGARSGPSFRSEVATNKQGEFRVPLPLAITKHVKKIKGCSVRLVSSNHPNCAVAATADSSSLHLRKTRKDGMHILSAGFFTFRPQLCDQKTNVGNNIKRLNGSSLNDPASFPPPLHDPPNSGGGYLLPPLLPLPRLPPLLGIPLLPPTSQYSNDAKNQPENAAPLPTGTVPPAAFPPVLPAVPSFPSQTAASSSGVAPAVTSSP